jgi:hypothetical protein
MASSGLNGGDAVNVKQPLSLGEAIEVLLKQGSVGKPAGDLVAPALAAPAGPKPRKEKPRLVPAAFVFPGTWLVPLHVTAGDNQSAVNRAKIGRAGHERTAVGRVLATALGALAPLAAAAQRGEAVRCRLVRVGGREMDYANVVGAMKYVQDTVALFLGVGDGPRGPVKWEYDQSPGGPCGVRIELSADGTKGV